LNPAQHRGAAVRRAGRKELWPRSGLRLADDRSQRTARVWRSSRDGIPTKPWLCGKACLRPSAKKVAAAAMDMGARLRRGHPHRGAAGTDRSRQVPCLQLLNEAVDKVRKEEHRRLLAKGMRALKGTKFLWLQGAAVTGERALRFEELCERDLKTARAWYHKETFVRVLGSTGPGQWPGLLHPLVLHRAPIPNSTRSEGGPHL